MCASTLNLREATPIILATEQNTYKDIQQILASSPIAGLWQKSSAGALTQDTKSSISKTKQNMYRTAS